MMDGWTMDLGGWLWMAAWALVIILVVLLLVTQPSHSSRDEPLDILRARLARGEISPEEFEQARRLLDP
jgi:putative membrane protein